MDKYLLISGHTAEECEMAVKYILQYHAGYLTHFEWGCYDNDHNAYAFVDADNHEQAKMAVPPLFRQKTKAIKVTNIKLDEKDIHDIKNVANI